MSQKSDSTTTKTPHAIYLFSVCLTIVLVLPSALPAADLFVFVLEDETDSFCSGNFLDCSLREAILQANLDPNHDTIHLPPGTLTLSIQGAEDLGVSGDLDILHDTTIIGPGAAATTVDGSLANERVLDIPGTTAVVAIEGITITGGQLGAAGGGIRNQGSLTMTDCVVRENTATQSGGGIYNTGDLTVVRSTIRDNLANASGGGIFLRSGTLLLMDSTITGNTAATNGGGLEITPLAGDEVIAVIDSTTFSANQGILGGGLRVGPLAPSTSVTIDITNSTFSGNIATSSGGGAFLDGTTALRHVTIAGNTAPIASAIAADEPPIVRSTVIEGDCVGTITSTGGNVESPGNTCGFDQGLDRPGEADPGLKPLAGYGGPTETHAILESSPARGIAFACPQLDQRGAERWTTTPVFCDSGAFEYGVEAPGTWIFADGFESGNTLAWSDSVP